MNNPRKEDVLEELPDVETLQKRMKQEKKELTKLRQLLTETYHKISSLETKVRTTEKQLSDLEDSTSNKNTKRKNTIRDADKNKKKNTKNNSVNDEDKEEKENSDSEEDDEVEYPFGFITV